MQCLTKEGATVPRPPDFEGLNLVCNFRKHNILSPFCTLTDYNQYLMFYIQDKIKNENYIYRNMYLYFNMCILTTEKYLTFCDSVEREALNQNQPLCISWLDQTLHFYDRVYGSFCYFTTMVETFEQLVNMMNK